MFFYVYLCKNKQVMCFKFEPLFVILLKPCKEYISI